VADAILDTNNQFLRFSSKSFQPIGSELTDDRFLFSLSNFYRKIQKDFLGYFVGRDCVFENSFGKGKFNVRGKENVFKNLDKILIKIYSVKCKLVN
jgi:hypothetical protein